MYLMPAAIRSDVTVLSPVCPLQAGAQTLGGASTDRGRFGGTGAEHHGRFDESDRAVHNNAACLLLLHKATTAPASSLLGPQRCWGCRSSSSVSSQVASELLRFNCNGAPSRPDDPNIWAYGLSCRCLFSRRHERPTAASPEQQLPPPDQLGGGGPLS